MREKIDSANEFLGTVLCQMNEQEIADFQQRLQAPENAKELIGDIYFDDPNSDSRKQAEAAMKNPNAPMPFGMQR